jgi:phosphoglycerate dehydrogenase-like enzyme
MTRLAVATQLPSELNRFFAEAVPHIDFVPIPMGVPRVPDGIEVLIAVPFALADDEMRRTPPDGWPFDLRWTQLVTVGTDFYPPWFIAGPPITSGRGNSAVALAEFALAAIFAHAKQFHDFHVTSPVEWQRKQMRMLTGSTLGLVGYGGLGQALAPRAQALGMEVVAIRKSTAPLGPGVKRADSLKALFEASDHVVLGLPATAVTRHMIDADILAYARPDLHLVNIARGALIDDDALLQALDTGKISRATLDVTEPEPLPEGHAFYSHPKIFLSPHCSTNSEDNFRTIAAHFATNLERFLRGDPLLDVINADRESTS